MENSFREFKRVSQQDKRDDVINIIIIKFHVTGAVARHNTANNGVPVEKIVCMHVFPSHSAPLCCWTFAASVFSFRYCY